MTPADNREWLRLTAQRYDSMKRRFGPKYDKRGLCRRPGMALGFDLDQYRVFLLSLFEDNNWHKTIKCEYCKGEVHIYNLQLDHRIAPSRGGSLDLSNLVPSCAMCNKRKGSMSHASFVGLLQFASYLPVYDREDLLGRLGKSTSFIFGRAHSRKKPSGNDWSSVRLNPVKSVRKV